jgi:Tfp pilus assembly protein PilN
MANNLIIDFSEDFVTLSHQGKILVTSVALIDFLENTELACGEIKREIKENNIYFGDWIATIPVACLNHQIVTLPENVSDKEKMIFLGLELDKKAIGKRFGIQKLDVTKRTEGEQELCDYMVIAPKASVYTKLTTLATSLEKTLVSVVPSLFLHGAEKRNELRASAWIGEQRSEVVIWGKDNPLSITYFENNGDQIGDVNRFIVDYFDNVDGLNLSKIYLFGPRMRDAALAFGLSYPYEIMDDPVHHLQKNLDFAPRNLNIATETKLPNAPLAMTPRNITMIVCGLIAIVICSLTALNYIGNFTLKRELISLSAKSTKYRKLLTQNKFLKKEEATLEAEYDFYIGITKRRTPWKDILTDISRMTPPEMWFERVSASKTKILISGKAGNVKDVSNFSINLNNNSKYVDNALVIGTRDYDEAGEIYSEFQMSTQLRSPTGQYAQVSM